MWCICEYVIFIIRINKWYILFNRMKRFSNNCFYLYSANKYQEIQKYPVYRNYPVTSIFTMVKKWTGVNLWACQGQFWPCSSRCYQPNWIFEFSIFSKIHEISELNFSSSKIKLNIRWTCPWPVYVCSESALVTVSTQLQNWISVPVLCMLITSKSIFHEFKLFKPGFSGRGHNYCLCPPNRCHV